MWWKKITFRNYFLAATVLDIISVIGIFAVKNFLPPIVPLFYGRPSGASELAPSLFLLIIPGVSLLIIIINILISVSIKDDFIKKILAVSTAVLTVMLTLTLVKIVLLVGFF